MGNYPITQPRRNFQNYAENDTHYAVDLVASDIDDPRFLYFNQNYILSLIFSISQTAEIDNCCSGEFIQY